MRMSHMGNPNSPRGPRRVLLTAIGVAIVVLPSFSSRANAIPAFARKYRTSCMTCHEMMPRLNAFGEAFRLNGFRWPEGAKPAHEEEPIPLGAEGQKRAFPNSVWPVDIPGSVPLALRSLASIKQTYAGNRETEWEWELQTGGTIGDKMSFFGHANFVSTSGTESATKNNLRLASFLDFQDLLHTKHVLNVEVGVVGFEESDFFHYRNHATDSLLPQSARTFGSTDTIPYPAGFDKPDLFKLFRGPGLMFWGMTPRTAYSLGYRIGDQAGGGSDMHVVFGQWAYKIGGMDHYGRTEQRFQEGYMENSLSFGVLGDVGSVQVRPTASGTLTRDKFWRAGADARLKLASFTARAGGLVGENSRPYGTLDPGSVRYTTWFVQSDYHVLPWLLPELRYEKDVFRIPSAIKLGQTDRARFVPSISALYGANVRFTLWGEIYTKRRVNAAGAFLDTSTVGLQLDFAL